MCVTGRTSSLMTSRDYSHHEAVVHLFPLLIICVIGGRPIQEPAMTAVTGRLRYTSSRPTTLSGHAPWCTVGGRLTLQPRGWRLSGCIHRCAGRDKAPPAPVVCSYFGRRALASPVRARVCRQSQRLSALSRRGLLCHGAGTALSRRTVTPAAGVGRARGDKRQHAPSSSQMSFNSPFPSILHLPFTSRLIGI